MQLQLSTPTAAALTAWSCLGFAVLSLFPARTEAAWHVALITMLGPVLVLSLVSAWRARHIH